MQCRSFRSQDVQTESNIRKISSSTVKPHEQQKKPSYSHETAVPHPDYKVQFCTTDGSLLFSFISCTNTTKKHSQISFTLSLRLQKSIKTLFCIANQKINPASVIHKSPRLKFAPNNKKKCKACPTSINFPYKSAMRYYWQTESFISTKQVTYSLLSILPPSI